jgi:hypothetical protein
MHTVYIKRCTDGIKENDELAKQVNEYYLTDMSTLPELLAGLEERIRRSSLGL